MQNAKKSKYQKSSDYKFCSFLMWPRFSRISQHEANTCAPPKVKLFTTFRFSTHPKSLQKKTKTPRVIHTPTRTHHYVLAMKKLITHKAWATCGNDEGYVVGVK